MAARIIAWREANGPFTGVEDLRSVSGIGDRTFDALKDLITI
jgi:competence protein ComEA